MIPEIGNLALILALCLAFAQSATPFAGNLRSASPWQLCRQAVHGQFLFLLIALVCLAWSFVDNDFSVRYVAQHSNTSLPLQYRLAAVWGGHEGSMLLWVFLLSGWTVALSNRRGRLPEGFMINVLSVMGMLSAGFLLFILLTSNPFGRLIPAAADGADLNPLLQDPALIIHPPMLYMGYVGFSVAWSFAIAALLDGKGDRTWLREVRPWVLSAWMFLTLGIGLGSWWAYYELGWGGWWFWDPVENASFMPWLAGTALIHSLAVSEKRGCFMNWTLLLAIMAFSLSLLGTFLVRSGILVSVHAFATDPSRGLYILVFLGLVVCGSLMLYAWRASSIPAGGKFSPLSRETMLLLNNVLLFSAAATVLLGTLYPLLLDALGFGKISVGPPWFNTVFIPLMAPMIFMMGIGPFARWKRHRLPDLGYRLRWAFAGGAIAGVVLVMLLPGAESPMTVLGVMLACWLAASLLLDLNGRVRRGTVTRTWLGMFVAHAGMAMFIFGVTLSGSYSEEAEVTLAPGNEVQLGKYVFRFDGVRSTAGPNYDAVEGTVRVMREGAQVAELFPQERTYHVQRRAMTEAAIDDSLLRHLYVALGEPVSQGRWSMRVYVKPFIQWIWIGVVAMAAGGMLAATGRRYRTRRVRDAGHEQAVPAAGAGT